MFPSGVFVWGRGRSRGRLWKAKAPSRALPESRFCGRKSLTQAIRKREQTPRVQASLPRWFLLSFSTRFAGAIAAQSACCSEPPAGERRFAAAKRARQPQLAFPNPLVFAAAKTAISNAPRTKAAVRGAALREFAKQTEKGAWKPSVSLLTDRIPNPFSYRLLRQRKQPTSNAKTGFRESSRGALALQSSLSNVPLTSCKWPDIPP